MEESTNFPVPALLLEAHERGVTRAAVAYVVAAFALYQVGDLVTVWFQLPLVLLGSVLILLRLGFPVVLILSWTFVWTPDGVRRAATLDGEWEASPRVGNFADAFVLGVALFSAALWGLKPRDGMVAGGAEVVAILPFAVTGQGANHLAEGMTDLLSLSLEATGEIRTPNARMMARRFREAGRPGPDEQTAALALGRGAGAGSVLTGSLTATGVSIQLSAILRRLDGWPMAEVHTEGRADDLFGLVDALTDELIHQVWRSGNPVPLSDIRRITSNSSEALNHYLRGEALFRRGQWRAAASSFTRALAADTAFALAHARLADTNGWADGIFTEGARRSDADARRFADRLPTRRRRLISARWLAGQDVSNRAPTDSLEAYLEAYPDDLEALHLLAEIRFHQRPLYGLGLEELVEPVERLLAVDSTMTAGLIHPIEVALQFGDRIRFERYLDRAEATGLSRAGEFRRAGIALWEAPETRADVARELMAEVGAAFTYTVGSYRVDVGSPADFREGLDAMIRLVPAERKVALWRARTLLLTSTGRLAVAADTTGLDIVPTSVIRAHVTEYPVAAGFTDPAQITRGSGNQLQGSDSLPTWELDLLVAIGYLASGDGQRGRTALDQLRLRDVPARLDRVASGLVEAARGWALLQAADTAAAIARLQVGLTQAGRWSPAGLNTAPSAALGALGAGAALSFRLVAAMASWGPTAEEGRRLLRDVLWPDLHYEVLRHYELGRSHERLGETTDARRSYDRFLRLLDGADEGLLVEDEMVRARQSLSRLGG